MHTETLINGLTAIFHCILLWNTSIWHNDMFYVHIIMYLNCSYYRRHTRVVQSASWLVHQLSRLRFAQSARCPVCELAYPWVIQLPFWTYGFWHVSGPTDKRMLVAILCARAEGQVAKYASYWISLKNKTAFLRLWNNPRTWLNRTFKIT